MRSRPALLNIVSVNCAPECTVQILHGSSFANTAASHGQKVRQSQTAVLILRFQYVLDFENQFSRWPYTEHQKE
jgi:hypothetical protein